MHPTKRTKIAAAGPAQVISDARCGEDIADARKGWEVRAVNRGSCTTCASIRKDLVITLIFDPKSGHSTRMCRSCVTTGFLDELNGCIDLLKAGLTRLTDTKTFARANLHTLDVSVRNGFISQKTRDAYLANTLRRRDLESTGDWFDAINERMISAYELLANPICFGCSKTGDVVFKDGIPTLPCCGKTCVDSVGAEEPFPGPPSVMCTSCRHSVLGHKSKLSGNITYRCETCNKWLQTAEDLARFTAMAAKCACGNVVVPYEYTPIPKCFCRAQGTCGYCKKEEKHTKPAKRMSWKCNACGAYLKPTPKDMVSKTV
jgi:hypothetical protein